MYSILSHGTRVFIVYFYVPWNAHLFDKNLWHLWHLESWHMMCLAYLTFSAVARPRSKTLCVSFVMHICRAPAFKHYNYDNRVAQALAIQLAKRASASMA